MNKRLSSRRGFTLVELMAVLLIIAILAGLAAKNILPMVDNAKVKASKAQLAILHDAVIQFKLDTGVYPSEDVGLVELVEQPTDLAGWVQGGYLKSTEVPKDEWKNEFVYMLNPENGKAFVIISYGADGKEGGEGNDMDLWSTDAD